MISHLTKRRALSYDADKVSIKGESEASLWHIIPHFTRGSIITTVEKLPRRLAPALGIGERDTQLRLVSMKDDDSTVWILRREGDYFYHQMGIDRN